MAPVLLVNVLLDEEVDGCGIPVELRVRPRSARDLSLLPEVELRRAIICSASVGDLRDGDREPDAIIAAAAVEAELWARELD